MTTHNSSKATTKRPTSSSVLTDARGLVGDGKDGTEAGVLYVAFADLIKAHRNSANQYIVDAPKIGLSIEETEAVQRAFNWLEDAYHEALEKEEKRAKELYPDSFK